MAAKRIVINTGPLIALSRMGALDLAGKLPFDFSCPREVRRELDAGARLGHPEVAPAWLRVLDLREPLSPLMTATLDRGEAAVIQLALEQNVRWVCIDESKGRRAALAAGFSVTGALGLLGRAKRQGIISAMKPFVDRATVAGIRYDPELVNQVLAAVGE